MSPEMRKQIDVLSVYMRKFILDKYGFGTMNDSFRKTTSDYKLLRRCDKRRKYKCNSRWNLNIDVYDQEAHLDCIIKCHNHSG